MPSIISTKDTYYAGNITQTIDTASFNRMLQNILQDLSTTNSIQTDLLRQIDIFENKITSDILDTISQSALSINSLLTKYKYLNNNKRFSVAEYYNLYDNTSVVTDYLDRIPEMQILKLGEPLSDIKHLILDHGTIKGTTTSVTEFSDYTVHGQIYSDAFLHNLNLNDPNGNFETNFQDNSEFVGETFYFLTRNQESIFLTYDVLINGTTDVNLLSLRNVSDGPFKLLKIDLVGATTTTIDVNTDIFYTQAIRFSKKTGVTKIRFYFEVNRFTKSNVLIQGSTHNTIQALVDDPLAYAEIVASNTALNENPDYAHDLFYIFSFGIAEIMIAEEVVDNDTAILLGKPLTVQNLQDVTVKCDLSTTIDVQATPASYPNETAIDTYLLLEDYSKDNVWLSSTILPVANFQQEVVKENLLFTGDVVEAVAEIRFLADINENITLYEDGISVGFSLDDKVITYVGYSNAKQYILEYTPKFVHSLQTINVEDIEIPLVTVAFNIGEGTINAGYITFTLPEIPDESTIYATRTYSASVPPINDTNISITNQKDIVFSYDPTLAEYSNAEYGVTYRPITAIDSGSKYRFKDDGSITCDLTKFSATYLYTKIYPIIIAYNIQQSFMINSFVVYSTSHIQLQELTNYNDGSTAPLLEIPSGIISELNIPISNLGTVIVGGHTPAERIQMGGTLNTDKPSTDVSGLLFSNYVVGDVLAADEAVVTNGAIVAEGNQYFTVFLRRSAVSKMSLNIIGNYSGLWIKMYGITGLSSWVNAFGLYDGSGVPGTSGHTDGCAVGTVASGTSGRVNISFGTANSTSATNSIILVRFKLADGNAITYLEIGD